MAKRVIPANARSWTDDEMIDAPVATASSNGPTRRRQFWFRFGIYTSLIMTPILAIALFAVAGQMINPPPPATNTSASDEVDSPGKAAAILAVNTWMAADPAPIVDGSIVSWDGYTVVAKPKLDDAVKKAVNDPDYGVEIHDFTLIDAAGMTYQSTVAVAVSPADGATVIGTPSLNPIAPSADGWAGDGAWYGLAKETAPEAVKTAVDAWAKTFTGGDPDALRQAVGDPDSSHSYLPLTGVTDVKATVGDAGARPELLGDGTVSKAAPKTLIVQVTLALTWKDAPKANPGAAGSGGSAITYDLLVQKADTASPVVVAWGGPGSGTTLEPYQQAVVGRDIQAGGDDGQG